MGLLRQDMGTQPNNPTKGASNRYVRIVRGVVNASRIVGAIWQHDLFKTLLGLNAPHDRNNRAANRHNSKMEKTA